jgi:predicted Zn-dependent protease
MRVAQRKLALKDALRVQSAELWLRLGDAQQALRELEHLTRDARKDPWTERVLRSACRAVGC